MKARIHCNKCKKWHSQHASFHCRHKVKAGDCHMKLHCTMLETTARQRENERTVFEVTPEIMDEAFDKILEEKPNENVA